MKIKVVTGSILIFLFLFPGCKDNGTNNQLASGPEVSWISGGTTMTYTYSGGVLSGYYFHRSFTVLKESGEITVNVQIQGKNGTKVSRTFNVQLNQQYSLKVKGSRAGSRTASPAEKCMTVVFKSSNSRTTQEISVNSYLVPGNSAMNTYGCPESLTFGEIEMQ